MAEYSRHCYKMYSFIQTIDMFIGKSTYNLLYARYLPTCPFLFLRPILLEPTTSERCLVESNDYHLSA
jgi:hypothetical protein